MQRALQERNEQMQQQQQQQGSPPTTGPPVHPAGVRGGPPPPWHPYWQMHWPGGHPRPPMPPDMQQQAFRRPRSDSGEDGERRTPDASGPQQPMMHAPPPFDHPARMWPSDRPGWEEAMRRGPPHPYYGYPPDYTDPRNRDPAGDYDQSKRFVYM